MPEPIRVLPCPACRKPVRWTEQGKHLPFCSERCRLIDFGSWANEQHRIPGSEAFDELLSEHLE